MRVTPNWSSRSRSGFSGEFAVATVTQPSKSGRIKQAWQQFKSGQPGTRFEETYKRRQQSRQSGLSKVLFMGAPFAGSWPWFNCSHLGSRLGSPRIFASVAGARLVGGESPKTRRVGDQLLEAVVDHRKDRASRDRLHSGGGSRSCCIQVAARAPSGILITDHYRRAPFLRPRQRY